MKILVTGASGFIGSNVVNELVRRKHKVRSFVRKDSDTKKISTRSEICYGDILDVSSLIIALEDVEMVIHSAAYLPYHKKDNKEYEKANVGGTRNVIKASNINKIKQFVYISTVGIYGTPEVMVSEKSETATKDIYALTKLEAEKVVKYQEKLRFTIIRPTIAYGEGDMRPGFSSLFRAVSRGAFIPIGKCENYLHSVYVQNLVCGICLTLGKESAFGEDFIIGDDPCPKIRAIIKQVYAASGKKYPSYYLPIIIAKTLGYSGDVLEKIGFTAPLNSRRVDFVTTSRRYSIRKAKEILKYRPKYTLKEGVENTHKWYLENNYL